MSEVSAKRQGRVAGRGRDRWGRDALEGDFGSGEELGTVGQTKHAGTSAGWGQFLVAGSSLAGRGVPSLCFLAC